MIQLATIGTSWITEQFIQAATEEGSYHLRAVYSRSKEKAQNLVDQYGGDYAADSLEDYWNDDTLEVIYIASPNNLHYEQAMAAIKAKKHLIVEKPIFSNTKEWESAFKAAEENGVYLFEAARHIQTKNYQFLKNLIQFKRDNTQYQFLGANLNIGQYSSKYDKYNEAIENGNKVPNVFNPDFSGGVLMDMGVYPVYVAVDLFGKPDSAEYKAIKGPNNVDLYGHIYFHYTSFSVSIFVSKAVHSTLHNEFYFDNETVRVPNITDIDGVEIISSKEDEKIMSLDYPVDNPLTDESRVFAEILLNKEAEEAQDAYEDLKKVSYEVSSVMEDLKNQI